MSSQNASGHHFVSTSALWVLGQLRSAPHLDSGRRINDERIRMKSIQHRSYEDECENRITRWENELKKVAESRDGAAVQALKTVIETELVLAEQSIKVRQ